MSHGGDEVPGVGMERELRAHLNVTNLVVEDTSGTSQFNPLEGDNAAPVLEIGPSSPFIFTLMFIPFLTPSSSISQETEAFTM